MTFERPFPNTYWVIPNRLLAGEYPGGEDDNVARARLTRLQAAGISRVLDLTEEGELPAYRHLMSDPRGHMRSAIVDCSVPYNVAQTQQALALIRESLSAGHNLYVHCRAGIGRTGLIVGCYLAEEQASGKSGLKQLNFLWRQSERSATWPTVPQTAEQADYVRRWPKLRALQSG